MRAGAQKSDAEHQETDPEVGCHDLQAFDIKSLADQQHRRQQSAGHGAGYGLKADWVGLFGNLPGNHHEKSKNDRNGQGPKRMDADGCKAGLDNQKRTGKANDTGQDPPTANFLVQYELADQEHDEGHYEGDSDGIC